MIASVVISLILSVGVVLAYGLTVRAFCGRRERFMGTKPMTFRRRAF
jgi:hypothetical protein